MALTLIRNRIWTPERAAREPMKIKGGWLFIHPPKDLARYNAQARKAARLEWLKYGAMAVASIVGGAPFGGAMGTMVSDGGSNQFPRPTWGVGTSGTATATMDAVGDYVGLVAQAPKTGSIRGFGIFINSVSGSPTADFNLEQVTAATGFPAGAGSLFDTNTQKTGVTLSAGWNDSGDFTADASVTRGTSIFAAVVRFATGTNFVAAYPSTNWQRLLFPYQVTNTAASDTKSLGSTIALRYSDGTYAVLPHTLPFSSSTLTETYNGATNFRGNMFVAPWGFRAIGGWVMVTSAADYTVIVAKDAWDGTADNDGTSNLAMTVDDDYTGLTAGMPGFYLSSASLDIAQGEECRILHNPSSATNLTAYMFTVNSSAIMAQMEWGTGLVKTSATSPTGAGSWTEDATKRFEAGFWKDATDIPAGGGLLTHAGYGGGAH